jgi:hypothetical protein
MIKKRVKAKEHENLSDANVRKVIVLLEAEKPITKKDACQILNISYNTTRLDTIIENYKHDREVRKELRAKRRGKAPTNEDIATVITSYLEGDPIYKIAERVYRPTMFVKNILHSYGIPVKVPGADFFHDVPLIPEVSVREKFNVGEVVYSARYHSLATIKHVFVDKKKQENYSLFIWGDDNQFRAYQPAYELASLEHLKPLGINFK